MASVNISLKAEPIIRINHDISISNSLMTSWLVIILLLVLSFSITRKLKKIPSGIQSIFEMLIETIYNLFESILHDKVTLFFPLLATIFLYIISLNWTGLLPGFGSIGINEVEEGHKVFVPLFRAGTADLNTTLALALITVVVIQAAGFKSLGVSYLKKFFNFSNPIYTFVGILELISEIAKVISFAFRLFGNIFAGEVLLTVIAFLMPVIAPLPFLGLEIFVGFIQALVFSMLASVFLSVATAKEGH